jgi:hypothetical protein
MIDDVVIAYRQKTGCKQYVFESIEEALMYFDKKCYSGETIMVITFKESKEFRRFIYEN